jgi:hypothetical protein
LLDLDVAALFEYARLEYARLEYAPLDVPPSRCAFIGVFIAVRSTDDGACGFSFSVCLVTLGSALLDSALHNTDGAIADCVAFAAVATVTGRCSAARAIWTGADIE